MANNAMFYPDPEFYSVRLFSLDDWPQLEKSGRPLANLAKDNAEQNVTREMSDADRSSVIALLNDAFSWAFCRAANARDIPEVRDQVRLLASLRRQATELLRLLGYDENGWSISGPPHAPAPTAPMMRWFQYLERAVPRVPDGLPGAYDRRWLVMLAEGIVPLEAIRNQRTKQSAFHQEIGISLESEDADISLDAWTISKALQTLPPALALLAALAETAARTPITRDGKATFARAFRRTLFMLLAGAYEDMFGEAPRPRRRGKGPGKSEGSRPGPPAHWAKLLLTLAAERFPTTMLPDYPLDPDGAKAMQRLNAVRELAHSADSTFATWMQKGWDEWKIRKVPPEASGST